MNKTMRFVKNLTINIIKVVLLVLLHIVNVAILLWSIVKETTIALFKVGALYFKTLPNSNENYKTFIKEEIFKEKA